MVIDWQKRIVRIVDRLGEQIGATDKQVAAMVSKARKFLKSRKDVLDLAGNI